MCDLYYYFSQDKNLFYYSCDMVRIGFDLYTDKNCLIEFTLIRATTAQLECDISC